MKTVEIKNHKFSKNRGCKPTLSILRLDKSLNEFVCGLCVQRQGIVQGQEVRTLLQESLLQTNTTSMEVLLH